MWLFENLKARILKSIITWSEIGQQTTQAIEVYYSVSLFSVFNYSFSIFFYFWRRDVTVPRESQGWIPYDRYRPTSTAAIIEVAS